MALMITKTPAITTVAEKYDVVNASPKFMLNTAIKELIEYNNHEGFGWMNASFQLGLVIT
jgi:neutral trehalase